MTVDVLVAELLLEAEVVEDVDGDSDGHITLPAEEFCNVEHVPLHAAVVIPAVLP